MIAKILIKRRFKEDRSPQIAALLNDLRAHAMRQPGYISGETLSKKGFPLNMVVISTWQSLEYWYQWRDSAERKQLESLLELYQTRPTDYEEFLLGSPLGAGNE